MSAPIHIDLADPVVTDVSGNAVTPEHMADLAGQDAILATSGDAVQILAHRTCQLLAMNNELFERVQTLEAAYVKLAQMVSGATNPPGLARMGTGKIIVPKGRLN